MEDVEEIFKDIEGYEGLYQVSNYGRVYSFYKNKILKCSFDKNGYIRVCLTKNKIERLYSIHRLVGITFIPNPENKSQINHINGDKTDNSVINLEWNTSSENISHSFKVLGRNNNTPTKGKFGNNSPTAKKVNQYNLDYILIKTWDSMIYASQELNISNTHISSCCTGKRKTAYGYIWKYYGL